MSDRAKFHQRPGDAVATLSVLVWVSIAVGPWWLGAFVLLVAWGVNLFSIRTSPRRSRVMPEDPRYIAKLALELPCNDMIHPAGAECAICNPKYVAGYCASPVYFQERLNIIRTALEPVRSDS